MITNFTQRWTSAGKSKYIPLRDYFNPRCFEVAEISDAEAKSFVRQYHYSGSVGSVRRKFGLFERGKLSGVAIYGHPMHDAVIKNVFGCSRASDGLELNRLVLLDSCLSNAESFFVAECHRRLRKEQFIGVVSFADDTVRYSKTGEKVFAGHLGVVYQSLGASYLLRGSSSNLYILPDGKVLSKRTISKIRGGESGWEYSARVLENFGAPACPYDGEERKVWLKNSLELITKRMKHPGNLRYAWSFSKKVKLQSMPYPKIKYSDSLLPF